MILTALATLALVCLWRLIPEFRQLNEIEQAFTTPKGAVADTLAGVRSASLGAGDSLTGRIVPPVSLAPPVGSEGD